jgi:hypothetical protein
MLPVSLLTEWKTVTSRNDPRMQRLMELVAANNQK